MANRENMSYRGIIERISQLGQYGVPEDIVIELMAKIQMNETEKREIMRIYKRRINQLIIENNNMRNILAELGGRVGITE